MPLVHFTVDAVDRAHECVRKQYTMVEPHWKGNTGWLRTLARRW